MDAVKPNDVTVVRLNDVEKIGLPGGSWSAMVISSQQVSGNDSALGYSVFKPGTVLPLVKHEKEEVAIVLEGKGRLKLNERTIAYQSGDALHIPAGVWHAVINDGDEDVVMVFCFPHPDYPPTERQD